MQGSKDLESHAEIRLIFVGGRIGDGNEDEGHDDQEHCRFESFVAQAAAEGCRTHVPRGPLKPAMDNIRVD